MNTAPHNPDNLTDGKIGTKDGWRLLTKQEISEGRDCGRCLAEIEAWVVFEKRWSDVTYYGNESEITYRTKLTPEALKCSRAK